jgi:hypothetical protein
MIVVKPYEGSAYLGIPKVKGPLIRGDPAREAPAQPEVASFPRDLVSQLHQAARHPCDSSLTG